MDVLAILVAAGRGERLKASRPKAFVELGGKTLLQWSAEAFQATACVDGFVAVVAPRQIEETRALMGSLSKLAGVTAGGERRQDSVLNGLRQAPRGFDGLVLVHDAARPFVQPVLIERVVAATRDVGAALPVLSLVDTIKRLRAGRVVETLDRSDLAAAQTPQGFRFKTLYGAYTAAGPEVTFTDEAMVVERDGGVIGAVPGSPLNLKITTPEDLSWARSQLAQTTSSPALARVGTGFDAHRLVAGRPLVLGGVTLEYDRGLAGHSDGDCVLHAVCDALLGAAALGDMGVHFPSSNRRFEDAASRVFLKQVARLLVDHGFEVSNVDATVIAEAPRLGPHLGAMRACVAAALNVPVERVSVKAKSSDGLGTVGRGEGVAAQAVALLTRRPE